MSRPLENKVLPIGQGKDFLTIIGYTTSSRGKSAYLVKCDCGNEKVIEYWYLAKIISCGCYRTKVITSNTEYKNLTPKERKYYKGKIIAVDGQERNLSDWAKVQGLSVSGISRRVSKNQSPLKTDKNYQQIEFNGETHSISVWAKIFNLPRQLVEYRHKQGIQLDLPIDEPSKHSRRFEYKGKSLTLLQWSNELSINYNSLRARVYQGWEFVKAIEYALRHKDK